MSGAPSSGERRGGPGPDPAAAGAGPAGRSQSGHPEGSPGGPAAGKPDAGTKRGRPPGGGGPGIHGPGGMAVMPVARARDFRRSSRRLLAALRPEAPLIALVALLALVSVTFAIAGPRILGHATNILFDGVVGSQLPPGVPKEQAVAGLRAAGQGRLADMLAGMNVVPGRGVDFDALGSTLLGLLGVYLASALFGWAQGYLMAGVTQRTVYRMRRDIDDKLGRLPLAYFDRQSRGDILSRITNDIDNIAQTLQQSLTQLITAVLTVIGVLAMMLSISPLLAVVSLLTVPASVVITMLIARRSQKQFSAQWERTGELNGHIEEMHSGHPIVKVFGRQAEAIRVFDEHNERVYDASFRAQFISGIIQPALNFVANLNYVAIAVIGGVRVASGRMTLGDVQAFIQYSRQFTMPIVQTASIMNVLQSAVASAERVFEVLDEAEEAPDAAEPKVLEHPQGRVALEGVSFRYESETPLIEDLDLVVEPGSTVAIVGPTGAGKTTLVNLLMRFYEIDAGRITIDGIDIRELARENLRCTFGMVLQDTWLFHGTIRENLAYGVDEATEEQVLAAARAAHVDHFVRTLPDGYDTVLEDEASNISQGERQLLTIARAFLVDPAILILDEATSSVDTRTEVLIQRAMASLMEGRTSFVIAHRLSTIRDADTILVMDGGRIVEQGTHTELIARRGAYAELYASQFERAELAPTPPPSAGLPHRPADAVSAPVPASMATAGHSVGGAGPRVGAAPPSVGPTIVPADPDHARRSPASRARRKGPLVIGSLLALALLVGWLDSRSGGVRDHFFEPLQNPTEQAGPQAAEPKVAAPEAGEADAGASSGRTDAKPAERPRIDGVLVVARGHVVPARAAALSFPIPGALAGLEVEEGQLVAAGELLARLDGAVEAAALLVAEADLRAAQAGLAEVLAALDGDAGPAGPATVEAAEAGVDRAAARLELARLRSERTVLRAPFAGRVAAIEATAFEILPPGSPVMRLMDDSGWLIETDDLSERDVAAMEHGDRASIRLEALPDVVLEGEVLRIRPVGQTVLGDVVFAVIVRCLQTDHRLRWNLSAEVTFPP